MSGLKSKVVVFSLMTVFAGCDVEAATGPMEPAWGGDLTLAILMPISDLPIEGEAQMEAAVMASGVPSSPSHVTWTSSDTVTAFVSPTGKVTGRRYGSVTVRAEAAGLIAEAPLRVVPGDRYSRLDVSYFQEIALGAEYGSTSRVIRKWGGDILIKVHGSPSGEDMTVLRDVVSDLRLVMGQRRIEFVSEGANVDLHFAPESDFKSIDSNYQSTNYGFFWVWWGADERLVRSRVLISTTDISQAARSHLIREELTQSLGLMNDSWRYPESIYYQGWTRTEEYAPIDLMVIEMLYRDEIQSGMTEQEALSILRELPRTTQPLHAASAMGALPAAS